jgi:hypothetical protein
VIVTSDLDAQQLAAVFVDDGQPYYSAAVIGLVVHEVVGPDLVEADRGVLLHRVPRVATGSRAGRTARHPEAFLSPDPVDPLLVDLPTFAAQQASHPSIACPWFAAGEAVDVGG